MSKDLVAIRPIAKPYLNLTWQVNDHCNFRCSYCNPGNWSGKNQSPGTYDQIIGNMELILDHFIMRGYQGFKFFFSGGEPTLWLHLLPLIKWLRSKVDDPCIAINTNLSRNTSWWQEHHNLFNDVVASYHPDFGNQDIFLENLIFLQDKVNYLCARMMMQESRFDEVIDFGEKIKKILKNYNLEWVPLFDELSIHAGPWKYSEPRMLDFFKTNTFESQNLIAKPNGSKWITASNEIYNDGTEQLLNGNRLVAERRNFFPGWRCHVDESLFINNRGLISAASCGQGPGLGNIYGEVTMLAKPVICHKHQCTCGTDLCVTKEKICD